ncbi:MAG: VWA domain-containing protein [Pseudomonadales bacterium]
MKQKMPTQGRSTNTEISSFLEKSKISPSRAKTGRILFTLDATASRQHSWDQACQLQGDMFRSTRDIGALTIKLCFYRGFNEFKASPWLIDTDKLLGLMSRVQCQGGYTQIRRALKLAIKEHEKQPVDAVVLIGDAMEENIDELCNLAGICGLKKLPVFIFQEGYETTAATGFAEVARLSGGIHCQFDQHSAEQLRELLTTIAIYATGGQKALSTRQHHSELVHRLLKPTAD